MLLDIPSSGPGKSRYHQITRCRVCGQGALAPLLDLGMQYLTGVFPRRPDAALTCGPLSLMLCEGCGLVQLQHSFEPSELYGDHYGYRSSLNASMVQHLAELATKLDGLTSPQSGDVVVDIGSNDGTLLACYPRNGQLFIGFDPAIERFGKYYKPDITAIPRFFSAGAYRDAVGARRAKVVTSIAMFYDLEQPLDFVQDVHDILADDGVWFLEQSYMPAMLEATAYDTICHEHLEYYGLTQIKWMADRAGLKIIDVSRNEVNGGSFALALSKITAPYSEATGAIAGLLEYEERLRFSPDNPFARFRERVFHHRDTLKRTLHTIRDQGRTILGYGASTKGNVLLQFCELGPAELPAIAEVNEDKFGCYTPGTSIPIVPESEARASRPDYFLVLPWHFRQNIVQRERAYLEQGGSLLFPLPKVDTITL